MRDNNLQEGLVALKLDAFQSQCHKVSEECERDGKNSLLFLEELVGLELESRFHRRIDRLIKQAKLPREKSLKDFEVKRIPGLTKGTIENYPVTIQLPFRLDKNPAVSLGIVC